MCSTCMGKPGQMQEGQIAATHCKHCLCSSLPLRGTHTLPQPSSHKSDFIPNPKGQGGLQEMAHEISIFVSLALESSSYSTGDLALHMHSMLLLNPLEHHICLKYIFFWPEPILLVSAVSYTQKLILHLLFWGYYMNTEICHSYTSCKWSHSVPARAVALCSSFSAAGLSDKWGDDVETAAAQKHWKG